MLCVRRERPEDTAAIRQVNTLAFGRPAEANLVDTLRAAGNAALSLVAVEDDRIVGHILFSPVSIEIGDSILLALGLAPLTDVDARHYWMKAFAQLSEKSRIILVAVHGGTIVGSVQLELALQQNAQHRAEVQKLLVLRAWRRQGIGLALMTAIEQAARQAGRPLVVLDTRLGDAAEQLYTGMGYTRVGVIPRFALSSSGTLDATVVFCRELST